MIESLQVLLLTYGFFLNIESKGEVGKCLIIGMIVNRQSDKQADDCSEAHTGWGEFADFA